MRTRFLRHALHITATALAAIATAPLSASGAALTSDAPLELALTPASPKATFTIVNDGTRLLAVRIDAAEPDCHVRFRARASAAFQAYRITGDVSLDFAAEREKSQLFDGLPQFPAEWTIEATLVGKEPHTLALRLEDQGPAPVLDWSEPAGTLLVRNAGQTRLTAAPERNTTLRHPLFSGSAARPDTTPAGDALFRLPAGYWQLSAAGGDGVRELRSALIPVTSGGETVVDWPQMRTLEGEQTRGLSELVVRAASADGEVGTLLVAAPMFATTPPLEAIRINEGGQPGEVLSIEPVPASLHVVVLFDSSLSMRAIFSQAQQAALSFVENLPAECTVDFFDFDSKVRELAAPDRAALLAAIRGVTSDGSTKLYDSIMRGLPKCAGHRRSAMVVFTDGFDAQVEDPGYGSRATQEQVFAAVDKARVPLFTIAYGGKPDEETLRRLAEASGGAYFRAQADTIAGVFDNIRRLMDRDYRITYRRPSKVAPSNTPVLTLVLDVSGSMDMAPSKPGVGRRIEKAKDLLRGFFTRLPAGSVVQLFTFSDNVDLIQVPTSEPTRLLRALAPVNAGGGTETVKATEAALASLEKIPSRNRYLLFITDAALSVPDQNQRVRFEKALGQLKEQSIRSLWVGMVDDKEQAPFVSAAELSGGSYVVSPGTDSVARALDTLEATLKTGGAESEIGIEVLIDQIDAAGAHHLHGGTGLFPLPVAATTAEHSVGSLTATIRRATIAPGAMQDEVGQAPAASTRQPAGAAPAESLELNRIPLERAGRTQAVEIMVREARIYSRLHGLDLPATHRFVELDLTITNVLPEQRVFIPEHGSAHPASWVSGNPRGRTVTAVPPYLIPDLRNHLFLRWNDGAETPPSVLSVLDPEPLFLPDDPALLVSPGAPIRGRIVFLVQGPNLERASLHLYDTAYGHGDIPLVGPLTPRPTALPDMPTRVSGAISDAFLIRVLGHSDSPEKVQGVAPGTGNVFRAVHLAFDSRVQALLNVQPAASFDLLIGTEKGPLTTPLAPVTDAVPGGLFRPASLAPGSHNRFQQLYCVPSALAGRPAALFVETRHKDLVLPFDDGFSASSAAVPVDPATGLAIVVNDIALAPKEAGLGRPMIVADVTITDVEDGFSTSFGSHFVLAPAPEPGVAFQDPDTTAPAAPAATRQGLATRDDASKPRRVHPATADLLFGFPAGAIMPDGATRRGLVLFEAPGEGEWVFAFHGRELARTRMPAPSLPAADMPLLARRPNYPQLDERSIDVRVERHVAELVRRGALRDRTRGVPVTPLADESGNVLPPDLEPPRLTASGDAAWKELLAGDEPALWATIRTLRLVPSAEKPWTTSLSPQAVLTQAAGTAGDLAALARAWYAARGIAVTCQQAALSEAGMSALRTRQPGGDPPKKVPVLATPTSTWVVPLAMSGDDAVACLAPAKPEAATPAPTTTTVTITVVCRPTGNAAATRLGDMSSALGGGDATGERRFQLWSGTLPTETLSRDVLDVLYYTQEGGEPELRVHLETAASSDTGKVGVPTRDWKPIREIIEVRPPGQRIGRAYERDLGEAPLDGTYHAVAIASPDLTPAAHTALTEIAGSRRTAAPPNHWSLLRWTGRSRIARFIAAQSAWERERSEELALSLARDTAPRVITYTACPGPDGSLRQSLDLRQSEPVSHGPAEARTAFHIMHGIADTAFEGRLLGGRSVADLWKTPDDFVIVAPEDRRAFADQLRAQNVPPHAIERVRTGPEFLLFSRTPVQVNGEPLWGWYEVDPATYVTRSVLSTGEHGMVEQKIMKKIREIPSRTMGFLVGAEVSLWAVNDFSLSLSEYADVLAQAELFARGLEPQFKLMSKAAKYKKFTDGYKAGIEFFFKNARAKPPKPDGSHP